MLAIAGGKGGCGKTTTTLGLATALPDETLAVDLDCDAPNLHAMAGVPPDQAVESNTSDPCPSDLDSPELNPSESDFSEPTSVVDDSIVDHPAVEGVRLHPPIDQEDVPAMLARLRSRQAVLLDCPAGAGPNAAAPLRDADAVLLVSTLCVPALRDTAKTAAMARELGTPVVGAVLTRTRQSPEAVERLLKCPVLASIPAAAAPVLEADVVRQAYARLASVTRAEGLL